MFKFTKWQNLNETLPTIWSSSMRPNARLSLLTSRLSPSTKYLPFGMTFDLGFAFGKSLTWKVPVM